MPWQQLVADVGLEVDGNGKPYYREVWVTVPRQNGKTTLVLAWELDRVLNWGEPQRVLYSAQNGSEAAKKLITEQAPLLERSALSAFVRHVYRANGSEAIALDNGSRIDILRDAESAGHGKTLDLAVMDEVFADTDDRREQAAIPAMSTRALAQILGLSTAGTETSVLLLRKRDLGRQAVAEDWDSGIAYFEWAAAPDADPDDEDTWRSCMPALGHTIDVAAVRHARQSMSDGEFRRAYLNQWVSSDDRVIPLDKWEDACGDYEPDGKLVFGFDVTPDRSRASVSVCDEQGRIELVAHNTGLSWLVPWLTERAKAHKAKVVLDRRSPAASLEADLRAAGVDVVTFDAKEMANACGAFYDAAIEGTLKVRRHYLFDEALAAAKRKTASDGTWYWARNATTQDISPLVAATMARRLALQTDTKVRTAWFREHLAQHYSG